MNAIHLLALSNKSDESQSRAGIDSGFKHDGQSKLQPIASYAPPSVGFWSNDTCVGPISFGENAAEHVRSDTQSQSRQSQPEQGSARDLGADPTYDANKALCAVDSDPHPSISSDSESSLIEQESHSDDVETPISSATSYEQADGASTMEISDSDTYSVPSQTPKQIVINSLIKVLRSWLRRYYLRHTRSSPNQVPNQESSSWSNTVTSSESQNLQTTSDRNLLHKRKRCSSDAGKEKDVQKDSKRLETAVLDDESGNKELLFACPFYKRRPGLYGGREWRSCRIPPTSWWQAHRIK